MSRRPRAQLRGMGLRLRVKVEWAAGRVISGIVTKATETYFGRLYYTNRWHPRYALLQDALDETVSYIKSDMRDAVIRKDAFEVLSFAVDRTAVDGLHLEFGVRTGTTVNFVARLRPDWMIHGFDSFEGLPEVWAGYTMAEGAFGGEGVPDVAANVELVQGWFDETLPRFVAEHNDPVAFVHIDSDIYSSAKTVLDHLAPRLQVGSVIVFNEYFNYPNWKQHEYRAWQEYCVESGTEYEYLCWGLYEVAVRVTRAGTSS